MSFVREYWAQVSPLDCRSNAFGLWWFNSICSHLSIITERLRLRKANAHLRPFGGRTRSRFPFIDLQRIINYINILYKSIFQEAVRLVEGPAPNAGRAEKSQGFNSSRFRHLWRHTGSLVGSADFKSVVSHLKVRQMGSIPIRLRHGGYPNWKGRSLEMIWAEILPCGFEPHVLRHFS